MTHRLQLNALRAFEATARMGSMSAAAQELGVTHGAISRHIRALEEQFGLLLVRRLPHAIETTPEGVHLAMTLTDAFTQINMAVARVKPMPLTLSCSATIMMYWLIPRLARFKSLHPEIDLRLNISHGDIHPGRDEISVAIRNSMYRPDDDMVVHRLIQEEVGPVCHPEYVAQMGLHSVSDIARCRILGAKTRPNGWKEWLASSGHTDMRLDPHESFEHFYLVIQAAACGLGLAMVPRILVEDEIRNGHIVAPFGFVAGPHRLDLWINPHLRARRDVRYLIAWLDDEIKRMRKEHRR